MEFLYYCAGNPVIYRSQCFVKFFEEGSSSPVEDFKYIGAGEGSIDSSADGATLESCSQLNLTDIDENLESEESKIKTSDESSFDIISSDQFDYLYDSAMSFSQAVQEEANLRYKPAFELYKIGIDKLLTGAKNDNNERRKQLAKTKAAKYLERAEMLYENQIVRLQDEHFLLDNQVNDDEPSVLALERPVNNLSRFKVIAINDYLMRVQDCTDKKFYVLKRAYKYQNCTISLPQSIPFMIKLVSYYKTEASLFLLLPLISGGLLWDYINNYKSKNETKSVNLEEMFVEPPSARDDQPTEIESQSEDIFNEIESVTEASSPVTAVSEFTNDVPSIPSFETLSSEMDINDLMNCSQKLLQSVSKTLEKSQVKTKVEPEIIEKEIIIETAEVTCKVNEVCEVAEAVSESPRPLLDLPESVLKQWFSELIVAVNHLHKAGIICGDLNLNNVLLGPMGHIALTYFYQVDRNEYQQLCRLNPNAMKCHYVAFDFPITQSSDWYSVGVIMYEIFTRERFYLNHLTGVSRFNEIQYSNPDLISDDVKNLLHGLIIEKSEKRFKFDDLTCHPFFTNIDWKEVEKCGFELFRM